MSHRTFIMLAGAAAAASSGPALAQGLPYCLEDPAVLYQIIDLGPALLNEEPLCDPETQTTEIRAQGINNRGDVVGRVLCLDGDDIALSRAFVWLCHARFGLPAHEIIFLNHSGGADNSAAYDINDAGVVVGFQGDGEEPSWESTSAVYWDLAVSLTPQSIPEPDLTRAEPAFVAYAVNNRDPFQAAGVYWQGVGANE